MCTHHIVNLSTPRHLCPFRTWPDGPQPATRPHTGTPGPALPTANDMHDNGRCSQRVAAVSIAIATLAVLFRLAFGVAVATTRSIGMTAAVASATVTVTAVARATVERTATSAAKPTGRRRQARHNPTNGSPNPPQTACSPSHPGPTDCSRANCSTTRRSQTGNPAKHRRETFTTIARRTANLPHIEFMMKSMPICH